MIMPDAARYRMPWGNRNFVLISIQEHAMRKVLHGYAKDKSGNLILIGTMPVPFSKDKCSPAARQEKRHLVRQGATIFKNEIPTRKPR